MESLSSATTTCFRLRHAPMGFHAVVVPTRITDAPVTSDRKAGMDVVRAGAANRESSEEHPLWPTLATVG